MKIFILIFLTLITSCKHDDKKSTGEKVFIVSKFNDDIEKRFQKTTGKNSELSKIKNIQLYDYPKGAFNFIFLKDGSVFYYKEKLFNIFCSTGLETAEPIKRKLESDRLHVINFNQIYTLLKDKSLDKNINNRSQLHHLSFSFENDSVTNFDIYRLLKDIDSLGYHSYNVRKIAPFESQALNRYKTNLIHIKK